MRSVFLALALVGLAMPVALAETARAAVAANFTATAEDLAADFAERTGHELELSFGSTGGLYTQITQGAPFDLFLAADATRPRLAVAEGHALEATLRVYAVGRLALCGAGLAGSEARAALENGDIRKLAIANPETAPYGAAALETLGALGLLAGFEQRFATAENVSQALQFVDTGNAELGFVAYSQIKARGEDACWLVPADLHTPIAQGAVLLNAGEANVAARTFLQYLAGPEAAAIIKAAGYDTE